MKKINKHVQQTPNPLAHGPLAVPPRAEHSDPAKQVPFSPFDVRHSALLNLIGLNNEKTGNNNKKNYVSIEIEWWWWRIPNQLWPYVLGRERYLNCKSRSSTMSSCCTG